MGEVHDVEAVGDTVIAILPFGALGEYGPELVREARQLNDAAMLQLSAEEPSAFVLLINEAGAGF